jgi:HTH-type transcriptional regulator / antitoxin HigA
MIRIGGKMPLTFDRETYAELLAQSQPKAIVNNRENEQAIALAEELSHRPKRSPEQ